MNYKRIYSDLMGKGVLRAGGDYKCKPMYELHHVFPTKLSLTKPETKKLDLAKTHKGKKVVWLTVREHLMAHKILSKILNDDFGADHPQSIKMKGTNGNTKKVAAKRIGIKDISSEMDLLTAENKLLTESKIESRAYWKAKLKGKNDKLSKANNKNAAMLTDLIVVRKENDELKAIKVDIESGEQKLKQEVMKVKAEAFDLLVEFKSNKNKGT